MACPHFYPIDLLRWPDAPRAPLGQPYRGLCRITGAEPADETLRHGCNYGYARAVCPHAQGEFPDAIRFSAPVGDGPWVEVAWVGERDGWPMSHGRVRVNLETGPADQTLERQAQAFAQAWERRLRRSHA